MKKTDIDSERAEFYGFLAQFSNGTTPCKDHLEKKYSGKLDIALKKGYIVKCGENSSGEPIYAITEIGRKLRDE